MSGSKIKIITLIITAASMMYELILAQSATALLGGTVKQYILVLGFYVFSMGLGSMFYDKVWRSKQLVSLELFLSIIGGLLPILTILSYKFFAPHGQIGVIFLAVLIGVLSGIEVPLLMESDTGGKGILSDKVMIMDYLGCLVGALCFSFGLYFVKDLFLLAFLISLLNLFVVWLIGGRKWVVFGTFILISLGSLMGSTFYQLIYF